MVAVVKRIAADVFDEHQSIGGSLDPVPDDVQHDLMMFNTSLCQQISTVNVTNRSPEI